MDVFRIHHDTKIIYMVIWYMIIILKSFLDFCLDTYDLKI